MEIELLILVLAHCIVSCLGFQKSVVINEPCNSNQQYRLGLNDYLYIAADGDKFIESSCGISLYAHDDKYQCSNLCFSVANYNLQTCDLQLAIYDSNVWKFGTNPSFVGKCNNQLPHNGWCSSGQSANIRLENKKGMWASMVGRYNFQVVVSSRCSSTQTAAAPYKVSDQEEPSIADNNTMILIGAILGCVIICMGMFIMFLVWYIKRQAILSHQSATSLQRSISQGSAVYHAVQESCDGHVSSEPIQVTDKMLTDEDESHRVWNQPTAPPIEEDCDKERPPSYHETCIPPSYENTNPNTDRRDIV